MIWIVSVLLICYFYFRYKDKTILLPIIIVIIPLFIFTMVFNFEVNQQLQNKYQLVMEEASLFLDTCDNLDTDATRYEWLIVISTKGQDLGLHIIEYNQEVLRRQKENKYTWLTFMKCNAPIISETEIDSIFGGQQ